MGMGAIVAPEGSQRPQPCSGGAHTAHAVMDPRGVGTCHGPSSMGYSREIRLHGVSRAALAKTFWVFIVFGEPCGLNSSLMRAGDILHSGAILIQGQSSGRPVSAYRCAPCATAALSTSYRSVESPGETAYGRTHEKKPLTVLIGAPTLLCTRHHTTVEVESRR
jgi:hypothetical protein